MTGTELTQMEVPTRSCYVMAIVPPTERADGATGSGGTSVTVRLRHVHRPRQPPAYFAVGGANLNGERCCPVRLSDLTPSGRRGRWVVDRRADHASIFPPATVVVAHVRIGEQLLEHKPRMQRTSVKRARN